VTVTPRDNAIVADRVQPKIARRLPRLTVRACDYARRGDQTRFTCARHRRSSRAGVPRIGAPFWDAVHAAVRTCWRPPGQPWCHPCCHACSWLETDVLPPTLSL